MSSAPSAVRSLSAVASSPARKTAMKSIRLLDLGSVSPLHSQTVYHAVGHALDADAPDTIILVSSDRPYVCIGYHQAVEKEVDLDYCRERGLPVYRREVGGVVTLDLDDGQLFTQWVFHAGPSARRAGIALRAVRPAAGGNLPGARHSGLPAADQRRACRRQEDRRHRRGPDGGRRGCGGQPDVHLRQGHNGVRA